MTLRQLLAAFIFCATTVVRADYISTVNADSPYDFWYLDEPSGGTATDHGSRGSGGNLTYVNSPTLGVTGKISGHTAVTFNGTDQWVRGTNLADATNYAPANKSITLECWFNESSTTGGILVGSAEGSANCGTGAHTRNWYLYVDNTGFYGYIAGTDGSSNCVAYMRYDGITPAPTVGNWYLFANAFDKVTPRYTGYVNGVSIATTTTTTNSPATHNSNLAIAAWNDLEPAAGPSSFWHGTVQMCAIYQAELSAARELAHYNAGVAAPDPSWPYITRKPELPQFRNRGYYDRLVRAGYNTGLFDLSVKFPRYFTVGYLPFQVVPNGRGQ